MNYSIKEIAEKVGIAPHVLRYYEKEGLLPSVERGKNGFRQYTEEDVRRLELVCSLRDTGMQLSQIHEYVAAEGLEQQCRLLQEHLANAKAKIAEMEQKTGLLEQYLARLEETMQREQGEYRADALETQEVMQNHAKKYPCMRPQDAVKILYQNEFGGGHIIANPEASLRFLQEEFLRLPQQAEEVQWESIGGGMVRLSLYGLQEGWLPAVNWMFVAGAAAAKGDRERFERKLDCLQAIADQGGLPFSGAELADFLDVYRRNGCPMVSHSPEYRAAYHPAYRVIPEKYAHLLPVVVGAEEVAARKGHAVIAVDGPCGSGKSVLSGILAEICNAAVVRMDDFFLPPEKRTPERLAEAGGNVDRERFLTEVADGLREGSSFSYRIFDCSVMGFRGQRVIPERKVMIVEGSYSQHPDLAGLYDRKVFVTCPLELRKKRIFDRDGAALYPRFLREWIPMEERYFEIFSIEEQCDWVYDSSVVPGCFVRTR